MAGFQNAVDFVENGERVEAGVANRAPRAIDANTRYLRQRLDTIQKGETLIAECRTVESSVQVGQPVYWNDTHKEYRLAKGAVDVDPSTGALTTAKSAQVAGIILKKINATKADILLAGIAEVDLSQAVDAAVSPGLYYLSNSQAGKLTSILQPVSTTVLQVLDDGSTIGTHEVLVNPQFSEFIDRHRHFKYDLKPVPAGDHSPPAVDGNHVITNPDSSIEGWLPANHSVFGGKAPAGAKFGYNLSASTLNDLWPPIPVASAYVELAEGTEGSFERTEIIHGHITWDAPNIPSHDFAEQAFSFSGARPQDAVLLNPTLALPDDVVWTSWVESNDQIVIRFTNTSPGAVDPPEVNFHVYLLKHPETVSGQKHFFQRVPEEFVLIDLNGIWWMTDCFNEVPWDPTLETTASASASLSESCPTMFGPFVTLWFTKSLFFNQDTAVLSLRGKEGSGLSFVCRGTDDVKATGHLEAELDLSLLVNGGTQSGHLVFKSLSDNTFQRGPVVEAIKSGSPEIKISSNVAQGSNGENYGIATISADLDLNGSNLDVDTVRLDGVEAEFFEDVISLGFSSARTSSYRGRIVIPTRLTLPTGTKLKLRFWVLGRTAGTLPSSILTVTRRNLTRPSAVLTDAVALPLSDTALSLNTAATFDNANEYVEMETAEFDVSTGDVILFTVTRSAPDSYGADLLVLRQEGILVAGGA